MKIDLERDNLITLMKKLEDMEYESSVLNRSMYRELEKSKDSCLKSEAGVYKILLNTVRAIRSGEIKLNDCTINLHEPKIITDTKVFDTDNYSVVKPFCTKELCSFFLDNVDLDVGRVNETLGARYLFGRNKDSEFFDFNKDSGVLIIDENDSRRYTFKESFNAVSYKSGEGVYLLKQNKDGTYSGVDMIREITDICPFPGGY